MNIIKVLKASFLFGAIAISIVACNNTEQNKVSETADEIETVVSKTIKGVKSEAEINKPMVYNETQVDTKAMFGNCSTAECSEKKILSFVKDNIQFPKNQNLLDESLEQVLIVINKNGSLEDVKYVASSNDEGCPVCQQAAVDVVGKMKNWKPAMKDGKAVAMKMTIPVRIVKA